MEKAEGHHGGECEFVGEGMADIAGVGILVGFIGQAVISLVLAIWVFFLSKMGNLEVRHAKGTVEREIEHKRLEMIADLLMTGNDIQMTIGASYMISIFLTADKIDLYHLHLAFDIVSFVGISNAAVLVCWTFCAAKIPPKPSYKDKYKPQPAVQSSGRRGWKNVFWTPRHRVTYGYSAMFLALTITLCLRLDEWDLNNEEHGRCYYSHLVTTDNSKHPTADKVYVIITAIWLLAAMFSAIFFGAARRRWILVSAMVQFPVHLWMTLALRYANQGKLEGEETDENKWDFGQTTAVVLLGVAVGDIVRQGTEYYYFERHIREYGIQKSESYETGALENQELQQLRTGDSYAHEEDEDCRRAVQPSEQIGRSQTEP